MATKKYKAILTILIPETIKDIPFHNTIVTTSDDSFGSSFAEEISYTLFKEFEKDWKVSDLKKISQYLTTEEMVKLVVFQVINNEDPFNPMNEGDIKAIATTTIRSFIRKIKALLQK